MIKLRKSIWFISIIIFTCVIILSACFIFNGALTASGDKVATFNKVKASNSVRFVVMADGRGSDNGVNTKVVKEIMSLIKQLPLQPEFIIIPGDLVTGAKDYAVVKEQLQYFKKIVTQYYPADKFFTGVGNHETANGINGEKALGEVFTEFKANFMKGYNRSVYYFDRGDARFFMLNSDRQNNIGFIPPAQLNWIKSKVASDSKYNLFFFHEPAYPTGNHVGNSLDIVPLRRDLLWKTIDAATGSIAFCGHEHFYTRRHIDSSFNEKAGGYSFKFNNSVYQVTTGSFGAPLYKEYKSKRNVDVAPVSKYHFAYVVIDDSGMHIKVYDVKGEIIDEFEVRSKKQ